MNIKLIMEPDRVEKEITVKDNSTIESIAQSVSEKYPEIYPYTILLAKKNGRFTELVNTVSEGETIEFVDMRSHAVNEVYRRALTAIYLVALRDVFKTRGVTGISASIETSINHGVFTKLMAVKNAPQEAHDIVKRGLTEEEVRAIYERMREIVIEDLPFESDTMSKTDYIAYWNREGFSEKADILDDRFDDDYLVKYYILDGHIINYVGFMVPSTGYVRYFEVMKYRDGVLVRFPSNETPDAIPKFVDDYKMYQAYKEEQNWLDILDTHYVTDMNRVIKEGNAKDLILLSEALHEKKIAEIADEIKNRGKRIILIAGPSSSGKTTFARRLCTQLRVNGLNPLYMGTDDYFINREDLPVDENGEIDYEGLDAVDVGLFCSNMNDLLAGKKVDLPEFDFIDGKKYFGRRITQIDASQPIVIEGIHALNGKMTVDIDDSEKFKIYISPLMQMNIDSHNCFYPTDARMLRRMVRDYKYRGKSAAVTINDWPKVRAGENVNIFPYNNEADVLFNSNLPYESGYLAKYALPLLKEIKPDEPGYSEAKRMIFILQFFNSIDNDDYVPNNSIVREFIGGSVFVE